MSENPSNKPESKVEKSRNLEEIKFTNPVGELENYIEEGFENHPYYSGYTIEESSEGSNLWTIHFYKKAGGFKEFSRSNLEEIQDILYTTILEHNFIKVYIEPKEIEPRETL